MKAFPVTTYISKLCKHTKTVHTAMAGKENSFQSLVCWTQSDLDHSDIQDGVREEESNLEMEPLIYHIFQICLDLQNIPEGRSREECDLELDRLLLHRNIHRKDPRIVDLSKPLPKGSRDLEDIPACNLVAGLCI